MPKKTPKKEITFHYLKTSNYKTIHVDGVYGGLAGTGLLNMQPFVERLPIPSEETISFGDAKPSERKGKVGVIREIEANLVMDYKTMVVIHRWLGEKIDQFENTFLPPKDDKAN